MRVPYIKFAVLLFPQLSSLCVYAFPVGIDFDPLLCKAADDDQQIETRTSLLAQVGFTLRGEERDLFPSDGRLRQSVHFLVFRSLVRLQTAQSRLQSP
jgi:hypothetical protein